MPGTTHIEHPPEDADPERARRAADAERRLAEVADTLGRGGPHELTALRALEREHQAGAERPRVEELLAGVRAARAADAAELGMDTPCQSGAVLHLGGAGVRHPLAQGTPRAVVLVAVETEPGIPLCVGCARLTAAQVIEDAAPRAGTRRAGSVTVIPLPGTDPPRIASTHHESETPT